MTDSAGALFSAVLLASNFIANWSEMPQDKLLLLVAIAVLLSLYSFFGSQFIRSPESWFLGSVAVANLCYCMLTGHFMIDHWTQLSNLGKVYFTMELLVILLLALVEFRVLRRIRWESLRR